MINKRQIQFKKIHWVARRMTHFKTSFKGDENEKGILLVSFPSEKELSKNATFKQFKRYKTVNALVHSK